MGTFTEDAATATALLYDLQVATAVVDNSHLTETVLVLAGAMAPFLSDPESIDQAGANAIGEAMRNVDKLTKTTSAEAASTDLHDFLWSAVVAHFDGGTIIDCDGAGGDPTHSGFKRAG